MTPEERAGIMMLQRWIDDVAMRSRGMSLEEFKKLPRPLDEPGELEAVRQIFASLLEKERAKAFAEIAEACAKIAEEKAVCCTQRPEEDGTRFCHASIAAAIRARS